MTSWEEQAIENGDLVFVKGVGWLTRDVLEDMGYRKDTGYQLPEGQRLRPLTSGTVAWAEPKRLPIRPEFEEREIEQEFVESYDPAPWPTGPPRRIRSPRIDRGQ